MRTTVGLLSLVFAMAACGPSSGDDGDNTDGGAGNVDADPFRADASPPAENAAVYAHSQSTLYRVDPDNLNVVEVAPFSWPAAIITDSMTDIAIDKDGNMIGVSYTRVYAVDKETAVCTYLADLSGQFNGLSFVPGAGPDPNGPERLVGANLAGEVFEINPTTGASTMIGAYGGGWVSSGDIVSVRGFGTVATVTNNTGTDRLARLDPTTFAATVIGDTTFDDIWGVGFWKGKVFGFTDLRQFLLIDTTTGVGSQVELGNVAWWGAAVTTSAPIVN